MKTEILSVTSRKLAPFVMLFGFYLVAFGQLSPGGGFQGGVVLASGFMLLLLCQPVRLLTPEFSEFRLRSIETAGLGAFLAVGALGIPLAGSFLGLFEPQGGAPAAGYIFMLNCVISFKVGAGISLICLRLARGV